MGKLSAIITGTREPLLIIVVSAVILMQVSVLGGMLSTILISLLFFYRALSALMLMQASYRSEERRVGKSVDLGGRRIIKRKRINNGTYVSAFYISIYYPHLFNFTITNNTKYVQVTI